MLLYIRSDILFSKVKSIGVFLVEFNLRQKKWLLFHYYNLHKNQISNYLKEIGRSIDAFSSNYDNLLLLGDFQAETTEGPMKYFPYFITEKRKCNYVNVNVNVIMDKNLLQKPRKPLCIDLIMIKMPKSFQNSQAIKTELSDSHKMHLTLLKVFYNEQKPLIQYRSCKNLQMKLLLIISKMHFFFNSARDGKTVLFKYSKNMLTSFLQKIRR